MIAAIVGFDGLPAAAITGGTMRGSVEGGTTTATMLGTVSTAVVDAFESAATYSYVRLKIGGVWVPEADLHGPIAIDETLDKVGRTITFGLIGRQWSHLVTEEVFTRVAFEAHLYQGASPNSPLEETITGRIRFCTQESIGPVLAVTAGDEASYYDGAELCYEYPPLGSLTRGEHVIALWSMVGLTDLDVPDGEIYTKAIQANGVDAASYVADFVEPEGWVAQFDGSTLRYFEPSIKAPPLPPDWEWTPDDWISCRSEPPGKAPSRWVIRGASVISIDEVGIVTSLTSTVIQGEYEPIVATHQQDATGTLNVTGFSSTSETRTISRFVDERTIQGGRLIKQTITEYGWYNPRAAALVSATGPPAYDYRVVYVDANGRYVQWDRERAILKAKQVITPSYNANWDKVSQIEETTSFYLRTKGISNTGDGDPTAPTVAGVFVYDDDQSYATSSEEFGISARTALVYTYNDELGAQDYTTAETSGWYAPKSRVDSSSYWTLYDGTGQQGATATWRVVALRARQLHLMEGGSVTGEGEQISGWNASIRQSGTYDWGSHASEQEAQKFSLIELKSKAYHVVGENQITIVGNSVDDGRTEDTVIGHLPLPIFRSSLWTRAQKEPFEAILEDPTAEAWWGFARRVIQSEFVQTAEEGLAMLERLRWFAMADRFEILRREHAAKPGDTLLLRDPNQGLNHRVLVWGRRRSWDLSTGLAQVAYDARRPR